MIWENLIFTEKWAFWLFLLFIPLFIYTFFFEKKRYPNLIFSNFSVLKKYSNNSVTKLRFIPDIIRFLAISLVILSIAKPKIANSEQDIDVTGIDIAFVLDISTSMAAADFLPNDRLHVAKEVIGDFVKKRKNDRIALVVFNALSYIQAPLTLDHNIFDLLLKSLSMEEIRGKVDSGILEDGTAIGNALATAVDRLKDSETKSKIIILLTDGSNNKGNVTPEKAAEMASRANIKIYSILVGKSGKVPYPTGKDLSGRVIYDYVDNSVNPDLLKKIANETKAKFYSAQNREELEQDLYDIIDHLEQSTFHESHFSELPSHYHPFLIFAFFLLIFEFLLRVTKFKRFP
jgi:Ca-activated chloride channel family protein